MDSLTILGPALTALLFIAAAVAWGADSREPMRDDHRR
jgi:hypothetical protein